jgi:hypothetical protein
LFAIAGDAGQLLSEGASNAGGAALIEVYELPWK